MNTCDSFQFDSLGMYEVPATLAAYVSGSMTEAAGKPNDFCNFNDACGLTGGTGTHINVICDPTTPTNICNLNHLCN